MAPALHRIMELSVGQPCNYAGLRHALGAAKAPCRKAFCANPQRGSIRPSPHGEFSYGSGNVSPEHPCRHRLLPVHRRLVHHQSLSCAAGTEKQEDGIPLLDVRILGFFRHMQHAAARLREARFPDRSCCSRCFSPPAPSSCTARRTGSQAEKRRRPALPSGARPPIVRGGERTWNILFFLPCPACTRPSPPCRRAA